MSHCLQTHYSAVTTRILKFNLQDDCIFRDSSEAMLEIPGSESPSRTLPLSSPPILRRPSYKVESSSHGNERASAHAEEARRLRWRSMRWLTTTTPRRDSDSSPRLREFLFTNTTFTKPNSPISRSAKHYTRRSRRRRRRLLGRCRRREGFRSRRRVSRCRV